MSNIERILQGGRGGPSTSPTASSTTSDHVRPSPSSTSPAVSGVAAPPPSPPSPPSPPTPVLPPPVKQQTPPSLQQSTSHSQQPQVESPRHASSPRQIGQAPQQPQSARHVGSPRQIGQQPQLHSPRQLGQQPQLHSPPRHAGNSPPQLRQQQHHHLQLQPHPQHHLHQPDPNPLSQPYRFADLDELQLLKPPQLNNVQGISDTAWVSAFDRNAYVAIRLKTKGTLSRALFYDLSQNKQNAVMGALRTKLAEYERDPAQHPEIDAGEHARLLEVLRHMEKYQRNTHSFPEATISRKRKQQEEGGESTPKYARRTKDQPGFSLDQSPIPHVARMVPVPLHAQSPGPLPPPMGGAHRLHDGSPAHGPTYYQAAPSGIGLPPIRQDLAPRTRSGGKQRGTSQQQSQVYAGASETARHRRSPQQQFHRQHSHPALPSAIIPAHAAVAHPQRYSHSPALRAIADHPQAGPDRIIRAPPPSSPADFEALSALVRELQYRCGAMGKDNEILQAEIATLRRDAFTVNAENEGLKSKLERSMDEVYQLKRLHYQQQQRGQQQQQPQASPRAGTASAAEDQKVPLGTRSPTSATTSDRLRTAVEHVISQRMGTAVDAFADVMRGALYDLGSELTHPSEADRP
ncbi:uncharacterized protein EV422DRAFT_346304 [Fimicolochytrium jonesii]|uniref:uncharacterized protein n=1 Tax=Fimicolochytrium jonesii TaxID=1396493 RepID=UPI0022FF3BD9|nr:uncharacterized protein EV422DRAFT_346304 [Fimicolochytrium jonesii]KAI8815715.1 hypothetical protein EV422DRAFT_346304 [Fimicolochytrium jonesii]